MLEGIVLTELLSRGYDVRLGEARGKEIDFVCDRDGKRIYVQVAWSIAEPETAEREFRPFREIGDNHPKYVVTTDDMDMSQEGVIHRNVADFLIDKEIN